MQKWVMTAKRADFNAIAAKYGIDPVIARLIRNRDVIGDEQIHKYLKGTLQDLYSPHLLKGMDQAVLILEQKILEHKPIRIIGDYDIDGVTATTILLKGLKRLGADADQKIPDRITDGYGLNEHLVQQAAEDGKDTIVTCDNGIAAAGQIQLAKDLGMTVIVTDHHEVPYEVTESGSKEFRLPPADAVINPKQPDCPYPFSGICGAVVAWKLILALYEKFGIPEEEGMEFLELCAFATVGDVMDLKDENRILVKEGIRRMRRTQNPGLLALMQAQGITAGQVGTYHLGFVLGPCINASGRLDTAERALQLLNTEDKEEAARLAGDLKALNDSRKELTQLGQEAAIKQVEESDLKKDPVLVVYMPEVHESLCGIIAGRLREKFYKPAFVLTKTAEGVKGSGRSIENYSMYEELVRVKEYLTKFGGHPMAAGISLSGEDMIEPFRRALNKACALTEEDLCEHVRVDLEMPLFYISKRLIHQMELLEPFGKGNETPLYAKRKLTVISPRIMGKNRNVVKMRVKDTDGYSMEAVYFGDVDSFMAYAEKKPVLMLSYTLSLNEWNGRETIQLVIKNYY